MRTQAAHVARVARQRVEQGWLGPQGALRKVPPRPLPGRSLPGGCQGLSSLCGRSTPGSCWAQGEWACLRGIPSEVVLASIPAGLSLELSLPLLHAARRQRELP